MRVIIFAYACEPGRGSEPAAGWMWARMIAGLGEASVITRENNAGPIEAALRELPERDRLTFIYVDLPKWARFWKKGQRGVRLYYLLWQIAALRAARKLHSREKFDVVWHLTLANAWLGSLASLVGVPFVYGPVGGGPGIPWSLLPSFGSKGTLFEVARSIVRTVSRYLNPVARIAWRHASLILVQNRETRRWFPKKYRARTAIFPHAVVETSPTPPERAHDGSPTALFAGRVIPWKGVSLAISTLELLPEWRLIICGEGSDTRRLQKQVAVAGLNDRVEFRGWVDRDELQRVMRDEADVLLFPSTHDDSPFVVPEALSAGVPVVCLDRGGAPSLGGYGVAVGDTRRTIRGLAEAVREVHGRTVDPVPDMEAHRTRLRALLDERGIHRGPVPL